MVLASHNQLLQSGSSSSSGGLRNVSGRGPTGHLRSTQGPNGHRSHHNNSSSNNNNNHNDDSDSSEESDGNVVRVGAGFQAVVPDKKTVLPKPAPQHLDEHAVLVWSPYNSLPEKPLDEYISIAKEKYNYNMEQALGMLCWHKFDLSAAKSDLPNFTPYPDEWSVEDKVLFEQAYQFHDKQFNKIKQMLPDKSMASLVKYYYSWKKTRSKTSLMDKQVRKLKEGQNGENGSSDAGSAPVSEDEADDDHNPLGQTDLNDDDQMDTDGLRIGDHHHQATRCQNCCTTATGSFQKTSKGLLCTACYSFWLKTGTMKINDKRIQNASGHQLVKRRKVPKGMYIDRDDIMKLASGGQGAGEVILRDLDQEIIKLKRMVQNNKQIISQNKHEISQYDVTPLPEQTPVPRIMARFTRDEELLAVQGFRKYGKDFGSVAQMLQTKSEAHVKSFYANNERKLGLDKIIADFVSENSDETNHQVVSSSTDTHHNQQQLPTSTTITRNKNRSQET